jgi:hypothetical protein
MQMRIVLVLLVALAAMPSPHHARAGIVNGDFQTGDLTGWVANSLVGPSDIAIPVGVTVVNGSPAGTLSYSGTAGGQFVGSLLQDFSITTTSKLQFDITFVLSSTVAQGQSPGLQSAEVDVIDLLDDSIVSRIQAQGPETGPYTFGVGNLTRNPYLRTSSFPMPPANYELRLLLNLTNPAGPLTQGLLTIDNVVLLPEPSTFALAALGFAALVAWRWRRRWATG